MKWTYKIIIAPDAKDLEEAGNNGWEMVCIDAEFNAYFKKPTS